MTVEGSMEKDRPNRPDIISSLQGQGSQPANWPCRKKEMHENKQEKHRNLTFRRMFAYAC